MLDLAVEGTAFGLWRQRSLAVSQVAFFGPHSGRVFGEGAQVRRGMRLSRVRWLGCIRHGLSFTPSRAQHSVPRAAWGQGPVAKTWWMHESQGLTMARVLERVHMR